MRKDHKPVAGVGHALFPTVSPVGCTRRAFGDRFRCRSGVGRLSSRPAAPGSQSLLFGLRGTTGAKFRIGRRLQPFWFDCFIAGFANSCRQSALVTVPGAFDGGFSEQSRDIGGEVDFVHVILPDEKPLPQWRNNSALVRFVHLSQGYHTKMQKPPRREHVIPAGKTRPNATFLGIRTVPANTHGSPISFGRTAPARGACVAQALTAQPSRT